MIEIELHIIELERENFHVMIEGEFADGEKYMWIVDTGASKTVLNKKLLQYYQPQNPETELSFLSAGINEEILDTPVGKIDTIKFGELILDHLTVALIDLSHINTLYSRYSNYRIAGLLGSDILNQYQAIINYKQKTLTFLKK